MNKSIVFDKTLNLILAIALFVAGIMFCVSPALGEQWVSLIIGIGIMLVGVIMATTEFLKEGQLLSRTVIVGSVLTAIGIYLMVDRSIVSKLIGVIPYILIVTGGCIFADSFFVKFVRDKQNDKLFVTELVVGAVAVTLGGLILGIHAFRSMMAVVIGIALAAASGYYLYTTFRTKKTSNAVKAREEDTEGKEDKPEPPAAEATKATGTESKPAKKKAATDPAKKETAKPAKAEKADKGAAKPAKDVKTDKKEEEKPERKEMPAESAVKPKPKK